MPEPFPLGPSLWAATAPPAPPTPPLDAYAESDLCIVGGGYCGLSTALHAAQRGMRAIVLERHEVGWGGSGRNGGQVIPGLKYDPDELARRFPGAAGSAAIRFAGATADVVFDLIERHAMDVPHSRDGWVQGASSAAGMAAAEERAGQWRRHGVDATVLNRVQAAAKLGSEAYLGGWEDPRGGAVQPLAYARGLARAAMAAGARVHGGTSVTKLVREGRRWRVETATGAHVLADRVLLATNAYTGDLVPGTRQSIVAPASFQVATAPLSDNVRGSILPEGHVSSDTRKLLLYFRLDHEGRLLMGGRGPFREPNGEADWAHLTGALGRIFPQAAAAPIAFRWCGRVAMTRDYLPHLHEPETGLLINLGCMGRGIGLQTAMGAALAHYCASGDPAALPVPLTTATRIPMHALQGLYVSAMLAWYRLTDATIG